MAESIPIKSDEEIGKLSADELDILIGKLKQMREESGNLVGDHGRMLDTAVKLRKEYTEANKELEKSHGVLGKINAGLNGLTSMLSGVKNMVMVIPDTLNQMLSPWAKADDAAFKFGKTLGTNSAAARQLLDETIKFANTDYIGSKYNTSIAEMIELQAKYVSSVGRNLQLTDKQKESLLATSKVMGENATEFTRKLENLGVGLENSAKLATKMYNEAAKSGISFEKTSKYVTENLTKVQSYGFKNGVEGLTAMAKKAAEVNVNIGEAFKIADKIQSGGIQEAIKMGAGLQVLGGNFATMGDPMGLLYQGLNDVEGLQDRMIRMFTGYGGIQNGQFKISSANRLLVNQAAQTMGISPDEMFNMISRQAVRDRVEKQMNVNPLFAQDKELADLIKNTATLDENNEAVVNIGGKGKKLSEVTAEDKDYLKDLQKNEAEDIKDIAQMMRGYTETEEGLRKGVENRQAQIVAGIGDRVKDIYKQLGTISGFLTAFAGLNLALTALGGLGRLLGGFGGMLGGGGGIGRVLGGGGRLAAGASGTAGATGTAALAGTAGTTTTAAATTAAGGTIAGSGIGTSIASFLGTTAGQAIAGGAIGGIFTGVAHLIKGSWKGDRDQRNRATSSTIGATLGGAIGNAIVPVIGGFIGTALGQFLGDKVGGEITKIQDQRRGYAKDRGIARLGTVTQKAKDFKNLKGDYKKSEYEAIAAALKDGHIQDGELSKKLLKKIAKNGDSEIIAKYGNEKIQGKFDRIAQRMNARVSKGEFSVDSATVNLNNATFPGSEKVPRFAEGGKIKGLSHAEGGVYINAEGGEYVIAKDAVAKNERALDYINSGGKIDIKASNANNPMEPIKVKETRGRGGYDGYRSPSEKLEVSPIKLDVNGTIKLDSNGQQVDLDAIINNPAFLTQLSQMIERRLSDNINGGNFKEMRKNKQHTF